MKRIVAIDFELANRHYLSACALGIVVFEEGVLVYEQGFLIKPPKQYNTFIPEFIAIHNIQPNDVLSAMPFNALYQLLQPYFNDATLVAHNAPFDMQILKQLLLYYNIEIPSVSYTCTVLLSRKLFSNLANHKLNTVANHLKISLDHHQAHSDAKACMHIVLYGLAKYRVESIESLCLQVNVKIKGLMNEF